MKLSWQEIRNRAIAFSDQWKDAHYEMGETQGFYIDFFKVFGIDHRRVLRFEEKVQLLSQEKRGRIDGFWPGVLLIEQKSAGRDLVKAKTQAYDYFEGLRDRDLPKFVLLSDFQNFQLIDLAPGGESHDFKLADLHKHVELFGFMLGVERRHYGDQDEVSIKAAELLGKIHDALEEKNYAGLNLQRLMVRLLFLLFADDTGIFDDKDDFRFLIEENSDEDGRNIGRVLNELFEVLDTPMDERVTDMSPEFAKFPYVNGELFRGAVRTPPFDAKLRDDLLECCAFDWGAVSPAIFGSLFQSVMDKDERRKKGAHYTTEPNIMKVIGPLFLDELREEFEKLKADRGTAKRAKLLAFQEKLGGLNFIDPACGCGNFLVVTYRELRKLEQEVLEQVYTSGQMGLFEIESLSQVKLDQFYGIELEEFPAHIAEVAMWMTEHLANIELGRVFGKVFADIPLHDGASIHHGDALEVDWNEVLPHEQCFAVMGNPPFIGQSLQSDVQQQQMDRVFDKLGEKPGSLDYVSAWFLKAGAYVGSNDIRIALVATNSISQGEQVHQLWPILFDRFNLEIEFAHRTFAWGSDARGKAHVHVIIVGLRPNKFEIPLKRLFTYKKGTDTPDETSHAAISPYLVDAASLPGRHFLIPKHTRPISDVPKIIYGSKPVDDGNLILTSPDEIQKLSLRGDESEIVRPLIGAREYLHDEHRWCLWMTDISPSVLRNNRELKSRISAVRAFRENSKKPATQQAAERPHLFMEIRQPTKSYIVIPMHTSENRQWVPFGFFDANNIVHNSCTCIPEGTRFEFGVISSTLHMEWLRHVGGRIKSDYRYSNQLVYNTFPWPEASDTQRVEIEKLAQAVLDARDEYPDSSLADLYDPDTMPPDLRRAHKALDKAVDRLYRKKPFESDRERVEHLFGLYEKLVNPLSDADRQNKRTARNRARKK